MESFLACRYTSVSEADRTSEEIRSHDFEEINLLRFESALGKIGKIIGKKLELDPEKIAEEGISAAQQRTDPDHEIRI